MDDRKLLELAAKAAGRYEDMYRETLSGRALYCSDRGLSINAGGWWNPLTDPGDALRLAVALHLEISVYTSATTVGAPTGDGVVTCEDHGTDPLAATMRAITRAAAEIGKGMP